MAVPKRRKSKSRMRMRKRSHQVTVAASRPCSNCGQPQLPHRVCPSCGFYRGRQVVSIETG